MISNTSNRIAEIEKPTIAMDTVVSETMQRLTNLKRKSVLAKNELFGELTGVPVEAEKKRRSSLT